MAVADASAGTLTIGARLTWLARAVTIVLVAAVAFGIVSGWVIGARWPLVDMDVYWNAATQWREAGNPYALVAGASDHTVFRYAPWFAASWVPLTFLPRLAVEVVWSLALVGASAAALLLLLQAHGRGALPLAILMGGLLIGISASGNVQPLVVLSLVWGLERRSGPIWIALAASLKVVPILLVLVYAGRREWSRVALTLALTAVLWAPTLAFERPTLTTAFDYGGASGSLANVNVAVWGVVATSSVALAAWIAVRRSRYAWLAAAVSAILVLPRFFLYDATLLLPAAQRPVNR
jgi:hypothetical protein